MAGFRRGTPIQWVLGSTKGRWGSVVLLLSRTLKNRRRDQSSRDCLMDLRTMSG